MTTPNGGWLARPVARRRMLDRALALFGVLGDLAALNAAMLLAYWLRFRSGWIPVTKGEPLSRHAYYSAMLAVMAVWVVIFAWLDMYRPQRWTRALDEAYRVVIAAAAVLVAVMAASFLYRSFEYSRLTAAIAYVIAVVLVAALRAAGLWLSQSIRGREGFRRRVAVLGVPEAAGLLGGPERQVVMERADVAAAVPEVRALLAEGALDEVVLRREGVGEAALLALLRACEAAGAEAVVVPGPVDVLLRRGGREERGGLALVRVRDVPLDGLQRLVKRAADAVVAGVLLLLAWPLMLLIGLVVKLTSPGPALYRQTRVTEGGREFTLLKYRSMVQDAEAGTGAVWAHKGDPRTTRVGRLLRRTSLDELPQLLNVLLGDMSLIGPRPERPPFVEQFGREIPRYHDRHRMKAGITGLAQVCGERGGDSEVASRTRYDLYYVDHWSLLLDLQILVKTGFEVLFHRGAG
ncbi:MAG: sugar transferase [Armatimonadetes bacterium]|nr:sugar transferase [Armatimonadota bacterium]